MSFFKDLFFLNLEDYTNFGVKFPLGIFLIAFTVALSVATFVITYRKICISVALRRMIRFGATNEHGAKTLKELGLYEHRGVKRALSQSGQLTFMVKRVGDESCHRDSAETESSCENPPSEEGSEAIAGSADADISPDEKADFEKESNKNPKIPFNIDFENDRFFIHPDKLERAKRTLETDSPTWWKAAILSTVYVAILILFGIFADVILSAINNYLAP